MKEITARKDGWNIASSYLNKSKYLDKPSVCPVDADILNIRHDRKSATATLMLNGEIIPNNNEKVFVIADGGPMLIKDGKRYQTGFTACPEYEFYISEKDFIEEVKKFKI
jgi:hypothetical protein